MNAISFDVKNVYQQVKNHPDLVDVIPDELGVSFPVPLLGDKKDVGSLKMAFFHYYMRMVKPQEFSISAPRHKTVVNYLDARIVESKAVTSKSFGVDWDDSQPVGKYTSDPKITYEIKLEKIERLFELYNSVLSMFVAGQTSLSGNDSKVTKEFKSLFYDLSHPPLLPYYKSMNPEFFNWLDRQ